MEEMPEESKLTVQYEEMRGTKNILLLSFGRVTLFFET